MRLLAKIFECITTVMFFRHREINLEKFYDMVPKSFWDDHFTVEQTQKMVIAQEERLFRSKLHLLGVCYLSLEVRVLMSTFCRFPHERHGAYDGMEGY